MKPDITLDGYANAIRITVDNRDGKDWKVFRAEGYNKNYVEHATVTEKRFSEAVDTQKTFKYGAAFVEGGVTGTRTKDHIRPKRGSSVDPPVMGDFSAGVV